jgi:hypothetical protein
MDHRRSVRLEPILTGRLYLKHYPSHGKDRRKERAGPCCQDPARKACFADLLLVLFHQLINASVTDRDREDRFEPNG